MADAFWEILMSWWAWGLAAATGRWSMLLAAIGLWFPLYEGHPRREI